MIILLFSNLTISFMVYGAVYDLQDDRSVSGCHGSSCFYGARFLIMDLLRQVEELLGVGWSGSHSETLRS
jgi:hypothetical protein